MAGKWQASGRQTRPKSDKISHFNFVHNSSYSNAHRRKANIKSGVFFIFLVRINTLSRFTKLCKIASKKKKKKKNGNEKKQ